ncbi:MAG: NAD-dependent epimerase/dehydratase family protein [Pelolinea sp.]|nr:NAD-dependent epimerase/dehydratase family protein [Pelolinea sp.]
MDILITGNISTIALSLAKQQIEEGHSVVVTDATEDFFTFKNRAFVAYKITSSDDQYHEIYRSHSFDTVIFIAAQEDSLVDPIGSNLSKVNLGLETNLDLCQQNGVDQFIYISSYEVYGNAEEALENADPEPTSKLGQILLNGENLCRFYAKNYPLSISILHVPFIYGTNEKNSFLFKLVQKAKSLKKIEINAHALARCSFLHIDDLFIFIRSLFEAENKSDLQVFNLNLKDINFSFLAQQLNLYYPKVQFLFLGEKKFPSNLKIEVKAARERFNWTPHHQLIKDLPDLIEYIAEKPLKRKVFAKKIKALTVSYRPFLVWGEVILGAFLMHMLTVWSSTIIEFKYIDYRLLYVVIIGSTHGLLFGVLAALLAAVSGAINWQRIGLDWALLIYNVENWVPFAMFFLAGSVTGYVHDKKENEITFEQHQTKLIHEKYEFLYALYDEISSIKDRLREQVVGYRDSFGRFFRVANELNELDEDNIFLKALEVIEDLMKNDQIAIYSIESSGNYGRLEVKSPNMEQEIPRSLKLSNFSEALESLRSETVFQNKDLLPNYPSYIAPINNQGRLIGLVVIWEANFEQFTMYYFNLFKVITGLIQSSLVRAATFKNAQIEKLFIPSTEIMNPESFKQSLEIKKKMRRNKIADFLVVRVEKGQRTWMEFYEQLSKGIRGDDIAGLMNENDTHCYVLLANAGVENIKFILERLQKLDLESEYIEELESD